MKKIYYATINQNKSEVAILISYKVNFRAKKISQKGTLFNGKRSVYQEEIVILNVHASNNRAAKYVKQKLIELKVEMDKFLIIVGDFHTPLITLIEQLNRQSARI